jgi:hypothetical protein
MLNREVEHILKNSIFTDIVKLIPRHFVIPQSSVEKPCLQTVILEACPAAPRGVQ